jgi:hypothetical protein
MGDAIRRAYRVQSRMPERFEELLRRLAEKEADAPDARRAFSDGGPRAPEGSRDRPQRPLR